MAANASATHSRPRALDAFLSLAALLGSLVVVYLFADRHPLRLDLTRGGRFTLTEETLRTLADLGDDVTATAFYKDGDEARLVMADLLEEFAAKGKRFRYEFVDPDRAPGLARELEVKSYGTTVVASGERRTSLFVPSEAQLAAAILRVTRSEMRRVGFLTGHGERRIDDAERSGYSEIAKVMAASRVAPHPLSLLRGPADLSLESAIVIAGPTVDLIAAESDTLRAYLDRGGALLALVDPGPFPEIARLLAREGLRLGDDIVVDRQSQAFGTDHLVPVVTEYPDAEITRNFRLATFFPIARSVTLGDSAPAGSIREPFVVTSAESWGERDTVRLLAERTASEDRAVDRPGPLAIAVAAVRPAGARRARVVAIGDADFADNARFALAGNGDLFQNALAWAMGDEEAAVVHARERFAEPLVLSSREAALVFWVPVLLVPGAALAAAAFVLLRRR